MIIASGCSVGKIDDSGFFFSFWSDGEKLESPLIGSLDLMETYSYIKHIAYEVKVTGPLKFT